MGSSSGSNATPPPTGPTPTNAPIVPQGGSPVQSPWVNFIDPGMGMSTGFTPQMEAAMRNMYAPPKGPAAGNSAASPQMKIPQLAAPPPGSMRGQFQQAAQGVADAVNKAGSLDAYLAGRDQLANLYQLGRFRRGQGSGGYVGQSDHSAGYGSSARK